jgi:hypothetical protein
MGRTRNAAIVGMLSLVAILATPSAALAEETTCRGRIGARTVDNLLVPQGATCTLEGTRVEGTIKVSRRATLYAYDVRVKGNVQAEEASRVRVLARSRVNGSIQLDDGGNARVRWSTIGGSIQLKANDGRLLVEHNSIGADVQAFSNTGGVHIAHNRMDGNLQCKSNVPRPTGGDNVVEGNKEDQCARL